MTSSPGSPRVDEDALLYITNELSDQDEENILIIFLRTVADAVAEIELGLEHSDFDKIQYLSHQVKGSCRAIGVTGLGELAHDLELYSGEKNSPSIDACFGLFKQELSEVNDYFVRRGLLA